MCQEIGLLGKRKNEQKREELGLVCEYKENKTSSDTYQNVHYLGTRPLTTVGCALRLLNVNVERLLNMIVLNVKKLKKGGTPIININHLSNILKC